MEHRLVAFMMVAIVLAGGVAGSVLHGPEAPIQHLLPLEVAYPNVHSPILLSQPLGLNVNEILAAAGYKQAPAPVAEVSVDESAEARQVLEILNSQQLSESAQPIAIGDAATGLTVSGPVLPAPTALGEPAPPTVENQTPAPSPAPETPQPVSLPSPAPAPTSPPLPAPTAVDNLAPATDVKLLDSITRGSVYIDTNGNLQMKATVTSDSSGVSVVAAELPQIVDSVPVVVPEVPVVAVAKPSKGVSNVNVNVNVNVNGDGTGSSFNATSVSKINAPIEVEHECH